MNYILAVLLALTTISEVEELYESFYIYLNWGQEYANKTLKELKFEHGRHWYLLVILVQIIPLVIKFIAVAYIFHH